MFFGNQIYWNFEINVHVSSKLVTDNCLEINISYLPENWYEEIYKRGVALVDDHLVLSLIEEQENQKGILLKVIALYNNGTKYSARQAIVKIEGDNKTLVWDNHR